MIDQNKLSKIISGAQKLCSADSQGYIDSYRTNGRLEDGSPTQAINTMVSSKHSSSSTSPMTYTSESIQRSGMPDNIKKSMAEQVIEIKPFSDSPAIDSMMDSILKNMNGGKMITETVNQPQVQPQQPNVNQPPVFHNGGQAFDYGALKFFIKEAIEEYFSTRQPLNESNTLSKIGISEGKIKLIDNKGNIFSAILEHTGNINDKKKKKGWE